MLNILTPILLAVLNQTAPASQPEPAVLAGRKVEVHTDRPSIVSRDIDGKVRRCEPTPEEAAAAQLQLEGEAEARVDQVFTGRALTLDTFVETNLNLLTRLTTVESAPGKEKLAVALEVFGKSQDLRKDGPLDQQVRAAIPKERTADFNRILKEYWDAIADEDAHTPKPKGRLGAIMDEKFKSLGREVEAAYKRCERSGGILFYYLFDGLNLTPEQAKQLRPMCADYSMKGLDNNDKTQQGLLVLSAMQVLDIEQQKALSRKFKGQPAPKLKKK